MRFLIFLLILLSTTASADNTTNTTTLNTTTTTTIHENTPIFPHGVLVTNEAPTTGDYVDFNAYVDNAVDVYLVYSANQEEWLTKKMTRTSSGVYTTQLGGYGEPVTLHYYGSATGLNGTAAVTKEYNIAWQESPMMPPIKDTVMCDYETGSCDILIIIGISTLIFMFILLIIALKPKKRKRYARVRHN